MITTKNGQKVSEKSSIKVTIRDPRVKLNEESQKPVVINGVPQNFTQQEKIR